MTNLLWWNWKGGLLGLVLARQFLESKIMLSNDPVERKLLAKLNANKRKVIERVDSSARNRDVDEESEEDESESKTKVFGKKRPVSSTSTVKAKRI